MKLRFTNQKNSAFTLLDLVVVVVILLLFMFIIFFVTVAPTAKERAVRLNCVSNLKQDGIAAHIWAGDNNNLYPMQVSVTNGGAMELIATNNVAGFFQVMSNEITTTCLLMCPVAMLVTYPTNDYTGFGPDFCNKNISYFVGVEANESYPRRLMFGDDNFEINGTSIPSGVAQVFKNVPITWDSGRHDAQTHVPFLGLRHNYCGNIGFADGSVAEVSTFRLQQDLIQTGLATNRFAIP